MRNDRTKTSGIFLAILVMVILLITGEVFSHCDTRGGPVIADAKAALEKGDVTAVLKWVKKEYELEIRTAFDKTLIVRSKGPEAKELTDMYFFETLVRIHRQGEEAPYTGLKAAGAELEPVVVAADTAIEKGSVDELAKEIAGLVDTSIREKFERVIERRKHLDESVEAGREYVEAYVEFMHYVERLHNDAKGQAGHHEEPKETKSQEHHEH